MGRLSDDYIENLLDVGFGAEASIFPATFHIGLSSTLPTNNGANVTEPTAMNYARVAVDNDNTHWNAAANRSKANTTAITFPAATGEWGTMTHFVIYDSAVGGTNNFIAWGALDPTVLVINGAAPSFPAGYLLINAPSA